MSCPVEMTRPSGRWTKLTGAHMGSADVTKGRGV